MSGFKLPELPSDEELGITEEDRKRYEEDLPDDGPELSADEMAALVGESPEKAATPEKEWRGFFARLRDPSHAAAPSPMSTPKTEGGAEPRSAAGVTPGAEAATPPPRRVRVPEGPRSRWRGPLTLALLIGVCVVSSSRTGLPRPVPANAPDTAFSSARAMATLIDIARIPHPIGSPEHARVRGLLVDRLRELGLEPEVQTATTLAQTAGAARAATVRNIVARMPGTASTGAVLITAHYDSRELAPGASDDGAGVVAILEAVRALRAGPALRNDVIVLISDAEEPCLCGAHAFVDQHPWIDDVSVVLSFEMRGAGGPSIMFETNDRNGWVIRALKDFDPRPFANSLSFEVYRRMPNGTDFTEFKDAGKQGLNFAAVDRAYVYHQALDTPSNLSERTLQHHGLRALAGLRYLGDADLRDVNAPDAVYFSAPGIGLVVYGASWVLPISGFLLALALLGWLAARAGGARFSAVLTGLALSILGGTLSFGFALWLRSWVLGFYPETGSLPGSELYSEGWWVLSAAAGAFFVVTTIHGIARRWMTAAELSLGATAVPLALAVGVAFMAPLGAMNLQWPVAAALLGVIALGVLGSRASGFVGWLATLLLAIPVLVLLVPVIELVWLAMSVRLIAVLAVAATMALYLCLPALDSLRHPNSWWAPIVGLGVAAGAFGMAVSTANPSAERPAPSTLFYAYEHGTGSALWGTDPNADPRLDAESIEWAVQRAGSPFSRTRDMADFGYPTGPTPVTDAPLVDAPPPDVQVVLDSIEGPVRTVTLSVRSRIGAELLRFQRDAPGRTRILSLNGATIVEPDSLEWIEHYGQPDSLGVLLELRMPATEPIQLHVVEQLMRPRELLGTAPFERPADLIPDVNAMSDRAVFSYSVAAYADPRHAFMPTAAEPRAPTAVPAPSPSIVADSALVPPGPTAAPPDSAGAPAVPPAAPPGTTPPAAPR